MIDGEKIGELEYNGVDMFWLVGVFHSALNFDRYRELFEKLEELCRESESDEDLVLLEQVNNLGLYVENEQGQTQNICDFKITKGRFECKII